MTTHTHRRDFLKTSAAAGAGFWITGRLHATPSKSPNEQLQVACVGIDGKGRGDSTNASRHSKIFAVCDADRIRLEKGAKRWKTDYKFTDYREMLDQLGDRIDAVTVSTPDHNHAVIAGKAMKMGKHVYCQKPLTQSIWEARELGNIAREMGVVTQMGNQFTSYNPARRAAYQLRAGQVGTVQEVHIWTNRPIWPQGNDRAPEKPVPENLDWEAWIGRAPWRPYADGYHPFAWRGWWDFGTGALGDMACHTCNMPFMGLNMRNPTSVEAEHSGHNGDSYPSWSKIKYEFPELDGRAAFTMYWYDGGQFPPQELFDDVTLMVKRGDKEVKPDISGVLIIGDKAKMYAAGDYADHGIEITNGVEELDVDYPAAAEGSTDLQHNLEWYAAIADSSKKAMSNFPDYAGPLTETILLGNLAVYKGGRVEWDAKNLKVTSDPDLQIIVKPEFRDGYSL